MSQPKRYRLFRSGSRSGFLSKHDSGEYVSYADYESLKHELDWCKMRDADKEAKHRQMTEFMVKCVAEGRFKVFKNGDVKFGKGGRK